MRRRLRPSLWTSCRSTNSRRSFPAAGCSTSKVLTSCPSCLQGLSRFDNDAGTANDYIVVESARAVLGEDWLLRYVERATHGGIERVLV